MLSYILAFLYRINIILYKYILYFYYYLISYNSIKIYKNSKQITLYNLHIDNDDQIIIEIKNKKYSLINKEYNNNIIDIINKLYQTKFEISINKILFIKDIQYNIISHRYDYDYNYDDMLKFILMYYGPNNDMFENEFNIRICDIKDDKNNNLCIKKLVYINNSFEEITLNGEEYLY